MLDVISEESAHPDAGIQLRTPLDWLGWRREG
jgi:hypothetical protein